MVDLLILILIAAAAGCLTGFIGAAIFISYDVISEFLEGLS
jgi:hypothetical protein